MADNTVTVADPSGGWPDWIEICNPGSEPLSLGGYFLSDSPDLPTLYALPASWQVPAEGHLLVWATGSADEDAFSLPFKLSSDGESIGFYTEEDGGGGVVELDAVSFGPQEPDVSLARTPDCGDDWTLSGSPTPGAGNP
jgi:hypothetical protein